MLKKLRIMEKREKYGISILQIIMSFICAGILVSYMRISNSSVTVFPIAIGLYILQSYVLKNIDEFMKSKWWYLLFAVGISTVLIACKHMVIQFADFYSDVMSNYILKSTGYDVLAFVVLTYTFMLLSFGAVQALSAEKVKSLVLEKNCENRTDGIGVADFKWVIILTVIIFISWLPYLILYYPGIIYVDSTISIGEALGKLKYSNTHPFMFTMLVKMCISISSCLGLGNAFGCAIYSVLQMIYMAGVFAYSICWLRNKNISKEICFIVLLFFTLPRFWGLHAISMWKDPIFSVAIYFYSFKLFDLVYSRGTVSKDKKYVIQCIITILIMCFFRHNGQYVALVSLLLMICCSVLGKNKYMVKKGLILSTAITILFSGIVQGPVYRHFGIVGTATGAYGIPLQQVARTVVYDGNISDEEKEFLNEIMPLEKYVDNYSPGLVDHMKWSEDFNTEFFGKHQKEFLKVWMSLLIKNPKLFIEAWALETCGFWGLSYWELNNFNSNITMGVPRDANELKEVYDITSGSLLEENSNIDLTLKSHFSVVTQMPSVALCLWISLFMILYALVKRKWRYLLFFIPCLGNIATLLVATPITYWPRYGLSSICLLPVSILFPYLCKESEES